MPYEPQNIKYTIQLYPQQLKNARNTWEITYQKLFKKSELKFAFKSKVNKIGIRKILLFKLNN